MQSEHDIMLERLQTWRAKSGKTDKTALRPTARHPAGIARKKPLCATNILPNAPCIKKIPRIKSNTPSIGNKIERSQSTLKKPPRRSHASMDKRRSQSPSMRDKLEQWKAQKDKEKSATKSTKRPWMGGGTPLNTKRASSSKGASTKKAKLTPVSNISCIIKTPVLKNQMSISDEFLKNNNSDILKDNYSTNTEHNNTQIDNSHTPAVATVIKNADEQIDLLFDSEQTTQIPISDDINDEYDDEDVEFVLHSSLEPLATSPQTNPSSKSQTLVHQNTPASCKVQTRKHSPEKSSRKHGMCQSALKSSSHMTRLDPAREHRNVTFTTPLRCSPRLAKVGEGASRCDNTPRKDMRERLQQWLVAKGKTPSRYSHLLNLQKNTPADRLRKEKLKNRMPTPARPLPATSGEDARNSNCGSQQEADTLKKVNATLSECLTLLQEGCPIDHVCNWLDDICRRLPIVEQCAKYWLCRAMAVEMDGEFDEVIGVFEEAAEAGAQPVEEIKEALTALVMRIGSNSKLTQDNPTSLMAASSSQSPDPLTPSSPDIKAIPMYLRQRLAQFSGLKFCLTDATPQYKRGLETPYFTPGLMITPVRRSVRLEGRRSFLPDNLQDHDVCVSSLEDLPTDAPTEFILRPNRALEEEFDV